MRTHEGQFVNTNYLNVLGVQDGYLAGWVCARYINIKVWPALCPTGLIDRAKMRT